jgi:hypothetical protein
MSDDMMTVGTNAANCGPGVWKHKEPIASCQLWFSRTFMLELQVYFTVWMLGKAHKYLEERGALPL